MSFILQKTILFFKVPFSVEAAGGFFTVIKTVHTVAEFIFDKNRRQKFTVGDIDIEFVIKDGGSAGNA